PSRGLSRGRCYGLPGNRCYTTRPLGSLPSFSRAALPITLRVLPVGAPTFQAAAAVIRVAAGRAVWYVLRGLAQESRSQEAYLLPRFRIQPDPVANHRAIASCRSVERNLPRASRHGVWVIGRMPGACPILLSKDRRGSLGQVSLHRG